MKLNKTLIWSLVVMVIVAAVYRAIPGRPFGFAPQWALAIFSGAIIKDKKLALLFTPLSMVLSDLIYQGLYAAGLYSIPGFYEGQWVNYLLFTSVTVFGFFIRKATFTNVFLTSLAAPTYFFLISNFLAWAGIGEWIEYPKTWSGLMASYVAGLPFYKVSLMATLVFSGVLFGSWYFVGKRLHQPATAA